MERRREIKSNLKRSRVGGLKEDGNISSHKNVWTRVTIASLHDTSVQGLKKKKKMKNKKKTYHTLSLSVCAREYVCDLNFKLTNENKKNKKTPVPSYQLSSDKNVIKKRRKYSLTFVIKKVHYIFFHTN